MHPLAQRYFDLPASKQRNVQVSLCKLALEIWESEVATDRTYQESVAGTIQELDRLLPRQALESVIEGSDLYSVEERYREPICAMQDEDLVLPERAASAYYAIYNLFQSCILGKGIDNWLVANQALSALGEARAIEGLEWALNETP